MSKTMLGAEYMHEAKNVSSVLGRESDVRVVFEGEGASTDGETIKLPAIDNNLQMDERLVKVSRGYVDHEAAHVKWTDQTQWNAAINRFKRSKENVWDKKCAMNALEDVRIERKLTALYAGSKRNIETLAHSIQMELHDSLAESGRSVEDLDAIEIGAVSVTWYGRQIGGYGQSCGEAFEKLDVELQDVVKAAVHKIDDNSTTKDMVSIAEDLVKEFVRLAGRGGEDEEEEEEEEKGKGRKCDDGEDEEEEDSVPENSDEGDEGDDDGSGGDSDGDDSDGDSPDDISDGEDGEEETTEAVEEAGNGRHQESPVNSKRPKKASVAINPDELKEKSVTKELSSESNCESGQVNYEYKRFSDRYDKVISRKELHVDLDMYGLMLEETAGQINVLRRTLERKLAAKMKRSWVGGQTNGRMDSRRLVGAYTGSEHVYKQREESEDIDTAVMILIDHSGSMSRRIIMAAKSCVALASALENTNISYAIQGFTTDENAIPKGKLPKHSDCSKYNSILPLVTIRYKEFGDKLSRVKGFLGGMKDTCHYYQEYNIDGISLEQSGRELLRRPEKRKVLMVLSDGKPANPYMSRSRGDNKGYDYKSHLESVVSSLMNDGIDVFGIGIESDAVRNYYPNYAVLDDLADLESKVIGKMDDLLIGGLNVRKAS
jgi:cobaltochelatase CobT